MEDEDFPETLQDIDEHPVTLQVGPPPTEEERYEKVWALLERTRSASCEFTLVFFDVTADPPCQKSNTKTRAAKISAFLKDAIQEDCKDSKQIFGAEDADADLEEPTSTASEAYIGAGLKVTTLGSDLVKCEVGPDKKLGIPKKRLASFCLMDGRKATALHETNAQGGVWFILLISHIIRLLT